MPNPESQDDNRIIFFKQGDDYDKACQKNSFCVMARAFLLACYPLVQCGLVIHKWATGEGHIVALQSDGSLWTWGVISDQAAVACLLVCQTCLKIRTESS